MLINNQTHQEGLRYYCFDNGSARTADRDTALPDSVISGSRTGSQPGLYI